MWIPRVGPQMGGFLCLRAEIHPTLRSTRFAGVGVRAWVLTFRLRQTQLLFPSMPVRERFVQRGHIERWTKKGPGDLLPKLIFGVLREA